MEDCNVTRGDTAVVSIDLHRGHLDPEVATMPLPPELCRETVAANSEFFRQCRARSIKVIHLLTKYRDEVEILSNPAWRARAEDPSSTRKNVGRHNIEGMAGVEIMPELIEPDDIVIDTKKRYDCFIGTDLEFVLRCQGISTLWLVGVNTNSCVLATGIAASCRDFSVTVVSDCVQTMDGGEFHSSALAIFKRAFGWVMDSSELLKTWDGDNGINL